MVKLTVTLALCVVGVQGFLPQARWGAGRAVSQRNAAPAVQESIERGEKPEGDEIACPVDDVELIRLGEPIAVEDSSCDEGEANFEYWMRMTVPGEKTQEYFSKLMAEAKRNANFPGFKKGQIPPYARPQMVYFCLEEAINVGMLDALEAASVKPLEGENAKAEILEDIKALSKTYKPGNEFTFTAKLRAKQTFDGDENPAPAADEVEAGAASSNVQKAIDMLDSSLTKDELAEIARALQ